MVMKTLRAGGRLGAIALVLSLCFAISPPIGAAEEIVDFEGVASSYGVDFTLSNPSIPIGLVVQGAGPVAQALLNPINADGFASMPYPGDVLSNITGAAGALFLGGLSLPPYPFYTASTLAAPNTSANYPGLSLSSRSAPDRTVATATAGTSAAGFESTAEVKAGPGGTAHAAASTTFNAIQLGGLVTVAGLRSSAEVELAADGSIERSSSLAIGRISVPGLAIKIPETTPSSAAIPIPIPGFPQIGSIPLPPIPLPLGGTTLLEPDIGFVDGSFTLTVPGAGPAQRFAIPAPPVLDALGLLGVTVRYQPAIETPTGIIAASLTINTVLPAPPANDYINGETPISFAIGRASASLSGPGTSSVSDDIGGGLDDVPASIGSGSIDTPTFGDPGLPALVPTVPAINRPATPSVSTAVSSIQELGSAEQFYFVFIGVGLVGLFAGQILRLLGVRP